MVLDLFCGQGGSAYGISQALPQAHILGIDSVSQPRYPFEFIQMDALEALALYGPESDLIWASPPCQAYSFASQWQSQYNKVHYADLVKPTQELIRKVSRPYIIENVLQAPLHMRSIMLCGLMFPELRVIRHRRFETNPRIKQPEHPPHTENYIRHGFFTLAGNWFGSAEQWGKAIGVDWMDKDGLRQAIPPAFARYVTQSVMERLERCRTKTL